MPTMRILLPILAVLALATNALAQGTTKSHAIAVLDTPALPEGFPHFPYVNPNAPKGGAINLGTVGTFDNFNPFIMRGSAPVGMVGSFVILPGGSGSGTSLGHIWESLLTGSADEGSVAYGHIARTIELPSDRMWIGFDIRPEAKFSDGSPVTAEDVVWSFRTLLDHGRPSYKLQFADVAEAVAEGPRRVVFRFKNNTNRDLPMIVGGIPVMSKKFFDGRDFKAPLTVPPIGSGAYRVASFEFGRSMVFERNPDWWAAKLPTGIGTNNFDRVKITYYRDTTVAMEAFKAGQTDLRSENVSKNWATAYDFPAIKSGSAIKRSFEHHLPNGIQGFAMNTRRPVFADRRVREAIGQMFDFEWSNKSLFYGAYSRTKSYFSNSDLAATGLPSAAEKALLAPWETKLPPELYTAAFAPPVTDGSGNNREQIKRALELFKAAGWTIKDRKLVDASGKQMAFTVLLDEPSLERPTLPFVENLIKIGIDARVRNVDPSQYQRLTDEFDFDMIMMIYPQGDVPGNELRDFFTCPAVKLEGSNNVAGICDPAVDALVEKIVVAKDRDELRVATKALDRVLLWNWYLIPNWERSEHNIAWWDRFGMPDKPIREGVNFDSCWFDPAKAAANDAARGR